VKHRNWVLGFIAALGLTLRDGGAARAQGHEISQDVQIYAGYLFADRLLATPLFGSTPRRDDNGTFGARYTYHFTDQWGVQLSAGYSPNRAVRVGGGGSYLGLTTVDLDLEWDILPNCQFAGHKLIPYSVVGAGYASSDLNHSISAIVGTAPVTITDGNGYSANAGAGAKYYLTDNVFVDLDGRYRYLSKIVSNFGQGMNTSEASLAVGYRF
jgi:opacity protein-like surface antigen